MRQTELAPERRIEPRTRMMPPLLILALIIEALPFLGSVSRGGGKARLERQELEVSDQFVRSKQRSAEESAR